jgi:hypothetical protein
MVAPRDAFRDRFLNNSDFSTRVGVAPQQPKIIKDGVQPVTTSQQSPPRPPSGGSGVPSPLKKN